MITTIFLVCGLVCFVWAAIGPPAKIDLVATGLAFCTAAALFTGYVHMK